MIGKKYSSRYLVNAFSNCSKKGNPTAVYLVDDNFDELYMQKIASEEQLSETAFIKNIEDKSYQIRWFTPISEAPICIHATIASAHVLYEMKIINPLEKIEFFNSGNQYTVHKKQDWISVIAPSIPIHTNTVDDCLIYSILKSYKINHLGISGSVLFAELGSRKELESFIPDLEKISKLPYRALLITSQDKKYDFVSRYFAPSVGIDEDPVCGSAHCRLIPYWSQKLGKSKMIAYQASKRGGVIKCENLDNAVVITGQAITIK